MRWTKQPTRNLANSTRGGSAQWKGTRGLHLKHCALVWCHANLYHRLGSACASASRCNMWCSADISPCPSLP